MADKNKSKGDAITVQEQAKKIEELEKLLRDESREHDKLTKYRKKLEAELEQERNDKLTAQKEAKELRAAIQAARDGSQTTAQAAAQVAEKIQAAKIEIENLKQREKEARAMLQDEKNEKESIQHEAKLKHDGQVAEKEKMRKELEHRCSELEAENKKARQAFEEERLKNEKLKQDEAKRLVNAKKEFDEKMRKSNLDIKQEKSEKARLHDEIREVNERLKIKIEEADQARKETARMKALAESERQEKQALETQNMELRESEAQRRKEVMELNMKRWGPLNDKEWNEEEVKRLRKCVLKSRKDSAGNPINLKILVFGPTGNGKSSLCNGFRSAIHGTGHPTTYYAVADGSESLTSGFQGARYGDHWIIDMAGIFESRKIESSSIKDILAGKVPFYAEITDYLEVKDSDHVALPPPGKNDVACVVLVMKYDRELGTEVKRQINTVIQLAGRGVVSFHLVITRLDECDPQFNDPQRLPRLYESEKVQAAVKRISDETGIAPLSISFVKNYVRETETDPNTFILHLRVLEKIIFSAVEQVERRLDQKRQREMYKDRYCSCRSCFLGFFLALTIMSAVAIALLWHQDFRSFRSQVKSILSD